MFVSKMAHRIKHRMVRARKNQIIARQFAMARIMPAKITLEDGPSVVMAPISPI